MRPTATYIRSTHICVAWASRQSCQSQARRPAYVAERTRASISALQATLSSNPDTIRVYVAGSQADGTATETSDLDIYHIVSGNKWAQKHRDIIRDAVGGRMDVDIVVDSPETVRTRRFEYGQRTTASSSICLLAHGTRRRCGRHTPSGLRGAVAGVCQTTLGSRRLRHARVRERHSSHA